MFSKAYCNLVSHSAVSEILPSLRDETKNGGSTANTKKARMALQTWKRFQWIGQIVVFEKLSV